MLIISLATAGTVITLNIYKKGDDDEPVPQLLQTIFFHVIARILGIRIRINKELNSSVKEIFNYLKVYHINSSLNKFVNTETQTFHIKNKQIVNETELLITKVSSSQCNRNETKRCQNHFSEIKCNTDKSTTYSGSKKTNTDFSKSTHLNKNEKFKNCNKVSMESNCVMNLKTERPVKLDSQSFFYKNENLKGSMSPFVNEKSCQSKKLDRFIEEPALPTNLETHNCLNCDDLISEKRRLIRLLKSVNENLEHNNLKDIIAIYKQEIKYQWSQLAKVLDALLAYIFTISTLVLFFLIVNQ